MKSIRLLSLAAAAMSGQVDVMLPNGNIGDLKVSSPRKAWNPRKKRLRPASGHGNYQGRKYESYAYADASKRFAMAQLAYQNDPSQENLAEVIRAENVYRAHDTRICK